MTATRVCSIGLVDDVSCPNVPLVELAARWLVPMFDAKTQLFCHRMTRGRAGLVREGTSHRYTIMSLLGLHRYETTGAECTIAIRRATDALLGHYAWIDNIGDVGLLLWLSAAVAPERLTEVCNQLNVETALSRYPMVREARTMELAWFLTGLSYAAMRHPAKLGALTSVALTTFRLLIGNQGPHGIFGNQARWKTLSGFLRGGFGSFADQVYPIYALTRFTEAFGDPAARCRARSCADAICRLQGPLGQWWWHYDASTGRVLQRYPVYSVHQHGMGPMALFALGDDLNTDYNDSIYKGLDWIFGNNELGIDFRDMANDAIWRNLHLKGRQYRLSDALLSGHDAGPANNLEILRESRPYELGWLLYALSGRQERTVC